MQGLKYRLNYVWRVFATGWCFFSFSAGGVVLALLLFPVFGVFIRDTDRRRDIFQRLIHHSFRFFIGQMCVLGVMSVELHNASKLRTLQGELLLANHPTLIDVVLLISLMPRADCIVKEALWRHKWFGGVIRQAGYIPNLGPEALVAACCEQLQKRRPIIVFPEGTRTTPGTGLTMQRGAAHVALVSLCDMVPVLITCQPSALTKGIPWYTIPPRKFHVRLEVKETLRLQQFELDRTSTPLAARQLTRALTEYYENALTELAPASVE